MRLKLSLRLMALSAALLGVGIACSSEKATPIDLNGTIPETTVDDADPTSQELDDPNAESRATAIAFAEQQCLDDPTKDEGVVKVADPASGSVVAEIRLNCDEVRSGSGGS